MKRSVAAVVVVATDEVLGGAVGGVDTFVVDGLVGSYSGIVAVNHRLDFGTLLGGEEAHDVAFLPSCAEPDCPVHVRNIGQAVSVVKLPEKVFFGWPALLTRAPAFAAHESDAEGGE